MLKVEHFIFLKANEVGRWTKTNTTAHPSTTQKKKAGVGGRLPSCQRESGSLSTLVNV